MASNESNEQRLNRRNPMRENPSATSAHAPDKDSPRRPPALLLILLSIDAVLAFLTAVALMYPHTYWTIGLVQDKSDLSPISGIQIWNAPRLLIALIAASWALTLIVLVSWLMRRLLTGWGLGIVAVIVTLGALLLTPWEMLQVRYHVGPGHMYQLSLNGPARTWVFTHRETRVETLSDDSRWQCDENVGWRFAGLWVGYEFYPSLDKDKGEALVRARCERLP